ncbi:MAG: damage-inducible protein, partial [Proteobacteria bacterium]|nr:damage-inducible protein [Pseudomonadota bacterium]
MRWASDRIGNLGVVAFITGSGWLTKTSMSGIRKCLAEEYSSLYVIYLRGDGRKAMLSGEKNEGDSVFAGTMVSSAVSILVKNPNRTAQRGDIYFYDIASHGTALSRREKLDHLSDLKTISHMNASGLWRKITPDHHHDWLNVRAPDYQNYLLLGDKKSRELQAFNIFSMGVVTARDRWCINPSRQALKNNIKTLLGTYHSELARYEEALACGEQVTSVMN